MTKLEITRDEWNHKKDEWNKRMEEIKQEVMKYVNSKVNRFSRIAEVVEEEKEFEKTPSKMNRRFLYTDRKSNKKKHNKKRVDFHRLFFYLLHLSNHIGAIINQVAIEVVTLHNLTYVGLGLAAACKFSVTDQFALINCGVGLLL